MDREDRSDQIRVVDDTVEEEVVRLEAPQRVPASKPEFKNETQVLSVAMGDAQKVQEIKAESYDPEKVWSQEIQEEKSKSFPFGLVVLIIAGLAGLLFWIANYDLIGAKPDEEATKTVVQKKGQGAVPLTHEEELQRKEEALQHFTAMEELLRAFLKADSVEQRAQYVRDPQRVRPLMEDYYARNEFRCYEYQGVSEYHVVSVDHFPFIALKVDLLNEEPLPILIDDGPGGMKVDWESMVCYQPIEAELFIKQKVTDPTHFRVHVQRDMFYAYEFSDESQYACFKLTFRDSDQTLFGYVEKDTKLYKEFLKLFPEGNRALKNSLILSLAFDPGSRAPKSVRIHEILSHLWAYPPK